MSYTNGNRICFKTNNNFVQTFVGTRLVESFRVKIYEHIIIIAIFGTYWTFRKTKFQNSRSPRALGTR